MAVGYNNVDINAATSMVLLWKHSCKLFPCLFCAWIMLACLLTRTLSLFILCLDHVCLLTRVFCMCALCVCFILIFDITGCNMHA